MNYRLLQQSDRSAILSMAKAYYQEYGNIYGLPRIEMAIDALLSGEEFARLWIIEESETVIGYLCVTFGFSLETGGREFFIDEIYIKPKYRNKGVGSKALEFACDQSITLGAKRIVLEVEKTNSMAKRLYNNLGFEVHDRYLMSKFLTTQ
ncbi:N-acetyltransferase family protein [Kiloniella sp.]|uniref:GNAT family N-acetyltransferase n=1 Tax=Kiloniella sp. TaxID=1938587 RepID=UPI003B02CA6D